VDKNPKKKYSPFFIEIKFKVFFIKRKKYFEPELKENINK
jgi:hypothetical protein